jgi:transposase
MGQWPGATKFGKLLPMLNTEQLGSLSAEQLRALAGELIAQVAQREQTIADKERELKYRQAKIDQLTHEMAIIRKQLGNTP